MAKKHKKRHNSWIDIGFSVLIITLIVAGAALFLTSGKNKASSNSDTTLEPTPPIKVEAIDSNYPGIKIITETSNDTFAPLAIQYPESTFPEFNDKISTYITKTKNTYIQTMSDYKNNNGKIHGELNVAFETLLHHSGNYSFVVATNSLSNGASSLSEIRTFHLNPETGEIIGIRDVFENNEDNLVKIADRVKNELLNDEKLNEFILLDQFDVSMLPKWVNFSRFALTDDTLIFYFDQDQFSTIEAGTPIVKIALEEISEIIAQQYKPIKETETPVRNDGDKTNSEAANDDETKASTENLEEEHIAVESTEKIVALTFDDGPDPIVTRQILASLKKYEAKATFFMLGSRVDYYPEVAKEVQEAGHELGNHTWTHPDLTKMSGERIFNEIKNTANVIEKATGQQATVFRPPYGAENDTVRNQTDLPLILWDVDTLDWKHRNANQTLAIIKSNTRNGSNILMHDIHQSTADALDSILSYLDNEGYTFVTVSELE